MSTDYNARVELATRDDLDDDAVTALADYSPAIARSDRGWVEIYLSLPAESLHQAITTTLALIGRATTDDVLVIEVMPAAEFDARLGLEQLPKLVSVSEAAAALSVSEQAIVQRLESGSLSGQKVGSWWVIQRSTVAHD